MRPLSQSEWIIAALVAGFVIFLAMKGRLGAYWSLMAGGGAPASDKGGGSGLPGVPSGLPGLGGIGNLGGLLGQFGKMIGGIVSPASAAADRSSSSSPGTVGGTTTGDGQTQSTSYPTTGGGSIPPVSF